MSAPSGTGLAPGLLIAAARSGAGKTTLALGIGRALARRGLRIRPVKSGPDYIDAAFHGAATGSSSLNLDGFAMPEPLLDTLAAGAAASCDLVLAEGALGLHDGVGRVTGRTGSSADLAARFGWPVVLVLDVSGQGATAAALALGLARFDPRLSIAGVILNRVASERHHALIAEGFERIDLPILGVLGTETAIALPSRHLGLVQAQETAELSARLDRLSDLVESAIDLDRLLRLARPTTITLDPGTAGIRALSPPGQRIALARDDAFSFVYPHLLDGWREAGATILPFSPLADEVPPEDADACWLPGGYPELHAGRIAASHRFLAGLRRFAQTRPVHGECGGYMVLGESLEDADGRTHPMLGCLPLSTSFAKRRLHLGYRTAHLTENSALGPSGSVLKGHEFHHSTLIPKPGAPPNLAEMFDYQGRSLGTAGHVVGLVSGTYFHVIAADLRDPPQ